MSKLNLRYEIFSWLEDLKRNEKIKIEITQSPVLKEAFDLEISKEKK